jgi:hypothetical protein
MFDSFRTMASTRLRNVETPIESMFDESPPSTAGNSKTKRLSIQEILGLSWDGGTKITEEDEGIPTPMRTSHDDDAMDLTADADDATRDFTFGLTAPGLSLSNRDFCRLSIDDDDDDGWARDEENELSNHLSPPSSSVNSRRASPLPRHALASISGNVSPEMRHDAGSDRPRSTIFDWSEPSSHEKVEAGGESPRPKTVHGKQEMDLRGGRSANRKGVVSGHIRSQSVPVVTDSSDTSKPVPKFGTWGLSKKNASEDWDDDFDFEELVSPIEGDDFSMLVPASIQATQPTVKAHSGQIRELSLLVNDLKRLCRHGKDLDILSGPCASKWKEAEDIIELASPDEEDEEDVDMGDDLEQSTVDRRVLDDAFDDRTQGAAAEAESSTAAFRDWQVSRRRSVFSPEDDIFGGNWPATEEKEKEKENAERPTTPDPFRNTKRNSAMISSVMEAMQQQRSTSDPVKRRSPVKPSQAKLFFDTNSLQELVKRAGHLRDSLSDVVRRAELLTQSPAGTPRREKPSRLPDGSPAFTRVFTDPASGSPKRLPKSHSNNSVLSRTSVDSPMMQMMTVS